MNATTTDRRKRGATQTQSVQGRVAVCVIGETATTNSATSNGERQPVGAGLPVLRDEVCPTGLEAVGIEDKKEMSLAAFFAAKRSEAAARGWNAMADGYAGDLALIEMRGLLAQAEGRAA